MHFERLKKQHNASADEFHQTTETPEEFREIIELLLKLEGQHKETLKAAGCRWSNNKKLWDWHHAEEGRKWRRGKATMSDIRTKYGSQVFDAAGERTGYERIGATA